LNALLDLRTVGVPHFMKPVREEAVKSLEAAYVEFSLKAVAFDRGVAEAAAGGAGKGGAGGVQNTGAEAGGQGGGGAAPPKPSTKAQSGVSYTGGGWDDDDDDDAEVYDAAYFKMEFSRTLAQELSPFRN